MAKQKHLPIIPVRARPPQASLFPDVFTEQQEALLALADGTRTLTMIAEQAQLPLATVESLAKRLLNDGHLRVATAEETQSALAALPPAGRHEDAIRLAQTLLAQNRGDIPTLTLLANLYEKTARPQEAAAQWEFISQIHVHEKRLGEALVAARKAAALQPFTHAIQEALTELCLRTGRIAEAVRCWCAYARRLADTRKIDEALAIIDYAQSKIPNDDLLMFTEAEILAMQAGHPRKQEIPPHLLKKKLFPGNKPLLGSSVIGAIGVIFVLLSAMTWGIIDYTVRERLLTVCEEAERLTNDIAVLPLARKVEAAERVVEKLRAAAPMFSCFSTATYRNSLTRATAYRKRAAEELSKNRANQQKKLEQWLANPQTDNLEVLSDLLLSDDPESPAVKTARAEWRKWRAAFFLKKVDFPAPKADKK